MVVPPPSPRRSSALQEYESAGAAHRQIECLEKLAILSSSFGRHGEAMGFLEAAMRICEEHREDYERSFVLSCYGEELLNSAAVRRGAGRRARVTGAVARPQQSHHRPGGSRPSPGRCAALGEWRGAAVLLGALSSIWPALGFSRASTRTGGARSGEHRTREALGDSVFAAAYDEGRRMTVAEAVSFARGEPTAAVPQQVARHHPRWSSSASVSGRWRSWSREARATARSRESLVISRRTAEGHVNRIMTKLGFGSRASVAAWVAEQRAVGG